MNNPFEGLPRQEAEKQMIDDSIESNRKMDLEESDYQDIYDSLMYGGFTDEVNQIFKKNRLRTDEWNFDPKLDAIRKEVLREYVSQGSTIYDIDHFLSLTNFSPNWEGFKNSIEWRYCYLIANDASFEELQGTYDYFGVPIDLNNEGVKNELNTTYDECFKKEQINRFIMLIEFSGFEPDWAGAWKDKVTDKVIEILDDDFDNGARLNAIIKLTKGEIDWQGRLKAKVNNKFVEFFDRARGPEVGWLEGLSGIKPDWQGELKQEVYDLIRLDLRDGRISHLKRCLVLLDFKPDFEKEFRKSVVEAYARVITGGDSYNNIYEAMQALHEVVGFLPDFQKELPVACEEYLLNIFKSFPRSWELNEIKEFIKYTGYRPRGVKKLDELIEMNTIKYIKFGNYSDLLELHDVWDINEYFLGPDSREFLDEEFIRCLDPVKSEEAKKNIGILEKVSGISPDWQGGLKPALQNEMQSAFSKNKWDKLRRLQEVTGVSFVSDDKTRAQVLDVLNSRFERHDFDNLRVIQEATGVKLDYAGEKYDEIQYEYRTYLGLRNSSFKNFKIYNELHAISGVELSPFTEEEEAVAFIRMEVYLDKADVGSLVQMIDATKLDFNWEGNEEKVAKAYVKLLKEQHFQSIASLQKLCGIEPDWEGGLYDEVMDLYVFYINQQKFEEIGKMQEFTNVAPDWEGKLRSKVMDNYGAYVGNGYFVSIQKLQKLSGIQPDWEGKLKPKVMDYYTKCAEDGSYQSIIILRDLSKVQPDWEGKLKPKVMKSYGKYISKRNFDKIQELQDLSSVAPDWRGELGPLVIESYFYSAVGNREQEFIVKLEELTGISYDEVIKDSAFWDLVTENAELSLVKSLIIDADEVEPKVREVFERRLIRIYAILLNKSAQEKRYFDFVEFCIKDCGIKPLPEQFVNLAQKALNNSDIFNKLNILLKLCNYRGVIRFKKDDIKGKFFNARQIALIYALNMLPSDAKERDEFESQLAEFNDRVDLVKALINARGVPSPANRDEYCPWKNELESLLNNFRNRFVFESAVNIPAMVNYIQRFGMKNLPILAGVSMDLFNLKERISYKENSEEDISNVSTRFSKSENGIKLQQFLEAYGTKINLSDIKSAKDIDNIFVLLERVSRELKEAVLRDEVPKVLEQSPITMELFNSVMVRSGSWAMNDHGHSRETLMTKWREFKESGLAELPEFYKSRTYNLKSKQQESLDKLFSDEEISDDEVKVIKLKEAKQAEQKVIFERDEYKNYLAPFYVTITDMDRLGEGLGGERVVLASAVAELEAKLSAQRSLIDGIGDDPKQQKKKLGMQKGLEKQEELLQKISGLRERENIFAVLSRACDDLEKKILEFEADQEKARRELPDLENRLEKIIIQIESDDENKELKKQKKDLQKEMQKHKSKINQTSDEWHKDLERLNRLLQEDDENLTNESKEYLHHQRLLTAITYSFDQKVIFGQLNDAVRLLTMRMAELESPGHMDAIREAHNQNDKEKEFKAWKNFFQQELLEHFIDPDYADEPRKVAMPSQVNNVLESVWRLNNIRQKSIEAISGDKEKPIKHPFIKAVHDVVKIDAEIKAIENEGVDALAEKVEVTYSPCQGLGRIFAGDVGDACYTSYRHEFADGKFPNLHSLIMSKKENDKDGIKLLGSVLLIDGINVKGKKYLFARAVNPMDSVLKREIKAEEFLQALLDYLKTTAEEAGLDEAVLCVDTAATRSGSNRQEVFDTMVKMAKANNWPIADDLEQTSETNFKYRVWDAKNTRVYRIWQREEI